jgi:hypothetical protein
MLQAVLAALGGQHSACVAGMLFVTAVTKNLDGISKMGSYAVAQRAAYCVWTLPWSPALRHHNSTAWHALRCRRLMKC